MNVDVTAEIDVARPRAEVAVFAADPDNATTWYANIKSVRWQTEKPLRVGSRVNVRGAVSRRLLLLTESRRASRIGPDGSLVLLAEQDRSRWDSAAIDEGHAIVRWCLQRNEPGPYQLQAAINAVHSDAATVEVTDWS